MTVISQNPPRGTPALPTIGHGEAAIRNFLSAVKEIISVHERRSGNVKDSFVRVGELYDLGIITIKDGRVTVPISGYKSIEVSWIDDAAPLVAAGLNPRFVLVPYNAEVLAAYLLTNGGAGSCVVDIWRDTLTNFPPTSGDSITAASLPTISSGASYYDEALTGWTKNIVKNDIIGFNVDSTSTFETITAGLIIKET